MITASLLASATMAFCVPRRLATFFAPALNHDQFANASAGLGGLEGNDLFMPRPAGGHAFNALPFSLLKLPGHGRLHYLRRDNPGRLRNKIDHDQTIALAT